MVGATRSHLSAGQGFTFNLETVVERSVVCVHRGVGQGATTRNGRSIPRRSNTAMRREGRAIHFVATHPMGERGNNRKYFHVHLHAFLWERSTAVSRIIVVRA